ncbi:MAG: hypothetical protein K2R93_02860 [Gemmatimonadaceae bacterium]|nr:hypothetical protein [Gemmatimonadaceae bacterium]
MPAESPTLPPLALRVGITGHRWREDGDAPDRGLDPAQADRYRDILRHILAEIADAAESVRSRPTARWSNAPTRLSLVTALAEGADMLAAQAARDVGMVIELVVPHDLASLDARCAAGTDARALWDAAESRFILDGWHPALDPSSGSLNVGAAAQRTEDALIETNRRLVWNCDLLIAVWDGRPARGEAGTARVVAIAREEGVPVIHVPSLAPERWSVLDPDTGAPTPPAQSPAALHLVVRRLLTPPATATGMGHAVLGRALEEYAREAVPGWIVRHVTARLYKLVTFVLSGFDRDAGVRALPASPAALPVSWQHTPGSATASARRASWLDAAFRRADYFATAYAARHRSTFTTILALAPMAVIFAACGQEAPESAKGTWALAELAVLLVLIGFFFRSRQLRFHEKWLDYRLLAERLRHHGFLWMIGRASPVMRVPAHPIATDPRPAWVNWQYRALTRPLGVPPIALGPDTLRELAADVRRGLVEAQAEYCRVTHRIAHHADHWLHGLPWFPLVAAIGAALTHVVAHALHRTIPERLDTWITPIGVIGPAIGAALHGFANQAGFQELGIRADASAQQLERFLTRLDLLDLSHPLASRALGDLVLEIADVLGEDLAGWRVDWLARPLSPPG